MEEVDTLVVNAPNRQEDGLVAVLEEMRVAHHLVGDALSPRWCCACKETCEMSCVSKSDSSESSKSWPYAAVSKELRR